MQSNQSAVVVAVIVIAAATALAGCPPGAREGDEGEGEGQGEEGEGEGGEGEGEGEGVEGEGEGGEAFDCDNRSADTLAATVGAGWTLSRSLDVAGIDNVTRVAVDGVGRTVAFNPGTGLLEEWGTWPDIAPTGTTQDPIVAAHRAGFPVFTARSMVFEDDAVSDTLIFTYAIGVGGEVQGGLFIDRDGTPTSLRVDNPFGARLVGSRFVVSASGLLGEGAAAIGTPVQVWGLEVQAAPTAFALVTVAQPTSDVVRINRLGDDVLFSLFTAEVANATTFDNASHRFAAATLADAEAPLAMPAPAAGVYDGVVMDAVDVDGGVLVLKDVSFTGVSAAVEFIADDGSTEVPLVIDSACMGVSIAFAAEGDAVIGLVDVVSGDRRLLQLRRE